MEVRTQFAFPEGFVCGEQRTGECGTDRGSGLSGVLALWGRIASTPWNKPTVGMAECWGLY